MLLCVLGLSERMVIRDAWDKSVQVLKVAVVNLWLHQMKLKNTDGTQRSVRGGGCLTESKKKEIIVPVRSEDLAGPYPRAETFVSNTATGNF